MISGFVLAGGASRRMGQDKALLRVDGVALAARTAAVLAAGGCAPVSLVGRQAELAELGWPVLSDEGADRHPLWGVAAALANAQAPLALICPCDLVHLRSEHIEMLLAVNGPCVASAAGRVHPLLAVLPTGWAARALVLASEGGAAFALTGDLPPLELPERALHDANRPEDLPGEAAGG